MFATHINPSFVCFEYSYARSGAGRVVSVVDLLRKAEKRLCVSTSYGSLHLYRCQWDSIFFSGNFVLISVESA
jgi:hypothetical protein